MSRKRPKLIVFDLDYTLWPFWVDTHVQPPFRKSSNGNIVDYHGKHVKCYPEVPEVLENLYAENYEMGVASRTTEVSAANQLVDLFGWNKYFKYREIYPGSKVTHFEYFRKKSGFSFSEMLFFDDETRNTIEVGRHGILSVLVENGITKRVVEEGLAEFASKRSD